MCGKTSIFAIGTHHNGPEQRVKRPVATVGFAVLWLGIVLAATLAPGEPIRKRTSIFCVLCDEGTAADAVLNTALFLPLGAALGRSSARGVLLLAAGALLSLVIESIQATVPGRQPGLSDLLFNSLGTGLGVALVRSADRWRRPGRRLAGVLSIAAALGAASACTLTGVLFRPSLPEAVYYGGWTPRFGHLEWYRGRVLEASVGDAPIVSGGIVADSAHLRRSLLSGDTLRVQARAGPRPPALAPLVTVHDERQREIMLLGIDRDDVVYRHRTRAIGAGLFGPVIRVRRALHGATPGEPLSVAVRRSAAGSCVRVNTEDHCGLGPTVGSGWTLFLGGQALPVWLHSTLGAAWLAALVFPTGFWARAGGPGLASLAICLAAVLIVPASVGLLATPAIEWLGALAGLLAGLVSRPRPPVRHADRP
jgi:hypothetical protein